MQPNRPRPLGSGLNARLARENGDREMNANERQSSARAPAVSFNRPIKRNVSFNIKPLILMKLRRATLCVKRLNETKTV
jgi:hypothetical protein